MIPRCQPTSGASVCSSGQRRRARRVSGTGRFTPLMARVAAKHKVMVSHRRIPLSVINNDNKVTALETVMSPSTPTPVSDEYVREKLPLFRDSMLVGLRDVHLANPPQRSGFLPKELQIITNDYLNVIHPTHMLAVHAPKSDSSSSSKTQVTLYPTHELVLLAYCTNLPKLPESSCPSVVPVVPLALPSPVMYPYLQNYFYTKNIKALESFLLPSSQTQMHTTGLMRRLLAAHGLWGDACVLGVIDAPFYDMIERVWASLHQGLSAIHASASSA